MIHDGHSVTLTRPLEVNEWPWQAAEDARRHFLGSPTDVPILELKVSIILTNRKAVDGWSVLVWIVDMSVRKRDRLVQFIGKRTLHLASIHRIEVQAVEIWVLHQLLHRRSI